MKVRGRPIFLGVIVGILALSGMSARAAFVAYHDLGGTTADAPGAYVTDQGTDATQTIRLRNFADNADTGVDFTITGANGSVDAASSANRYPDAGTDAAAIFGTAASPIVTHGGSTNEGGNTGSGFTTFTFTGLQADLLYDVAIYGERAASNDGVEEFRIAGTDGHANASSSGTQIDTFTTRLNTRPNNTTGHVARWTNIDPGSDGTFSVEIDPEVTSVSNIAYLTAMRLQTVAFVEVPEVIYRETFGNDSGSDQALSYADWTGYYGSGATLLPSSGNPSGTLVSGTGAPTTAGPVNSDLDSDEGDNGVLDDGFGRLLWPSGGGVSPALVYTSEYPIDRSAYDVESFNWNQANMGSNSFRVALEIAGQWYVSDTAFSGPANNSSGTFGANAGEKALDFDTAQWRSLSFAPGSTLGSPGSIVALPGGDITSFGLYGTYNATQWFDTYTISATPIDPTGDIPEPATMAMLGLAFAGLGGYVRRRKQESRSTSRRAAMNRQRTMALLLAVGLVGVTGAAAQAALQVDIQASGATTQGGWQPWNFSTGSSSSPVSTTFAYADATDGTVDVTIDPLFNAQGRNYGLSNVTDPGNLTIPNVWADQYFWNNNTSGEGTLTLDDLKAGTYNFTSYHYANNLRDVPENDEGTASVFVNGVDTGLDVTFISGLLSTVSGGGKPSAADLDAFGKLSMTFTVPNDNDTVSILFDNLTGGDTFGLNGFELESAAPEGDVPEPATMALLGLAVCGLGGYVRRRKRS